MCQCDDELAMLIERPASLGSLAPRHLGASRRKVGLRQRHYADFAQGSGRQSRFCSSLRLGGVDDGAVLVTFVQGVIGALDKDSSPFHQTGGEETSERANQHFLDKCGVHRHILSRRDAIDAILTRTPTVLFA